MKKQQSITHKLLTAILAVMPFMAISCEREPILYLHEQATGCIMELPVIDLNLDVYWNYDLLYDTHYNWREEWFYGWDEEDQRIFGDIGYTEPHVFNIRRYHTGKKAFAPHTSVLRHTIDGNHLRADYNWGFWDILTWNDIKTIDGVQSLIFDEETSLDYVLARTNQTMHATRYNAPKYQNSFYEPEALFSAYEQGIEINEDMRGFEYDSISNIWVRTLNMTLEPITYIYLTQVILHHNNGRISGVDGSSNLSSMARSVNVNSGVAGPDAITVNYNVRFKPHCKKYEEDVDIAGGRLLTFGMCNINANRVSRAADLSDISRHYMDVNLKFNNGLDSTFVFDVTDQVKKRYKGGVITVELDVDTVPIPSRSGGSGFDAVVKEFEEEQYEFDM